ncbi:MAG: methyltransferase domain-containing protein [Chloroflexi bacterium]|nr:methyltransferase domain-containing protein [Chloroflexota bacterium]
MRKSRIPLFILILFLAWQLVIRLARKIHPFPCPFEATWLLENPFRKRFFGPQKILDHLGLRSDMRVLELGPGPGFFTLEAARRLGQGGRLYALDIQPRMIRRLRERLSGSGVNNVALLLGDGMALPFAAESLDLAFLVTVLGEIPDKDMALQELYRVLRPGGVLSVSEMLPDPDYSFRGTTIRRAERAGFELCGCFGNFFAYTLNFRKGGAREVWHA